MGRRTSPSSVRETVNGTEWGIINGAAHSGA